MKGTEVEVGLAEGNRFGRVIRWWDPIKFLSVPDQPVLRLFPEKLTLYCGANWTALRFVAGVTYAPELSTLTDELGAEHIIMKYRSLQERTNWLILRASRDGLIWGAEKFLNRKHVCTTIGPAGDHFLFLLSQIPISGEDKPTFLISRPRISLLDGKPCVRIPPPPGLMRALKDLKCKKPRKGEPNE